MPSTNGSIIVGRVNLRQSLIIMLVLRTTQHLLTFVGLQFEKGERLWYRIYRILAICALSMMLQPQVRWNHIQHVIVLLSIILPVRYPIWYWTFTIWQKRPMFWYKYQPKLCRFWKSSCSWSIGVCWNLCWIACKLVWIIVRTDDNVPTQIYD